VTGEPIPDWHDPEHDAPTIADGEGARVRDDAGAEYLAEVGPWSLSEVFLSVSDCPCCTSPTPRRRCTGPDRSANSCCRSSARRRQP